MLGQSGLGGSNSAANRVFVYEVSGLRQTEESENNAYDFRRSGSVFFKVPYTRMNEEMRRILRLGGTIINIKPYAASEEA
ncbi:MAG: phycobilisome linker polypeptide [Microcystaceae cyanobacterium]